MADSGISVVLPCYNHARFLPERIDSILCQSLPVSEIIFIDDASTDGSYELAKSLLAQAEVPVLFLRNSINSGSPFIQWNKGVSLASCPLVWIAETDDSCHPTLLERLHFARLASLTVMSFAQSSFVAEDGSYVGSGLSHIRRAYPSGFEHDFTMLGADFNSAFMTLGSSIPNASAVLFDRDAYLDVGMANEAMRFAGDWDLWIRIASKGGVSFVSDQLNYFRCHPSTTRSSGVGPEMIAEALYCKIQSKRDWNNPIQCCVNMTWICRNLIHPFIPPLNLRFRASGFLGFLRVMRSYSDIQGAPPISFDGWIALWIVTFFVYFRRVSLLRLASRIA